METLKLQKLFEVSLQADSGFELGTKDVPASIIAQKRDLNLDSIEGLQHEMLLPAVEIPKFLSPEPKSKLAMIKAVPQNEDQDSPDEADETETNCKTRGAFSNSAFPSDSKLQDLNEEEKEALTSKISIIDVKNTCLAELLVLLSVDSFMEEEDKPLFSKRDFDSLIDDQAKILLKDREEVARICVKDANTIYEGMFLVFNLQDSVLEIETAFSHFTTAMKSGKISFNDVETKVRTKDLVL